MYNMSLFIMNTDPVIKPYLHIATAIKQTIHLKHRKEAVYSHCRNNTNLENNMAEPANTI